MLRDGAALYENATLAELRISLCLSLEFSKSAHECAIALRVFEKLLQRFRRPSSGICLRTGADADIKLGDRGHVNTTLLLDLNFERKLLSGFLFRNNCFAHIAEIICPPGFATN